MTDLKACKIIAVDFDGLYAKTNGQRSEQRMKS